MGHDMLRSKSMTSAFESKVTDEIDLFLVIYYFVYSDTPQSAVGLLEVTVYRDFSK
jgi:hypothetical protein